MTKLQKSVKRLMIYELITDLERYIDSSNEIQCAYLAETIANRFDHDQWLDDPNHWVWDYAVDCAEMVNVEEYLKRG